MSLTLGCYWQQKNENLTPRKTHNELENPIHKTQNGLEESDFPQNWNGLENSIPRKTESGLKNPILPKPNWIFRAKFRSGKGPTFFLPVKPSKGAAQAWNNPRPMPHNSESSETSWLVGKSRHHHDSISSVKTLSPRCPIKHTMNICSVPPSQSRRLVTDSILKSNLTKFLFLKYEMQQTWESSNCRIGSRLRPCALKIINFPLRMSPSSEHDQSQSSDENLDENSYVPRGTAQIRATAWVLHGEITPVLQNNSI